MPINDLDRQLLIVASVGDVDPTNGDPVSPVATGSTGVIVRNIGRLWQKYADKALVDARLRDLYVSRDAHNLVMGVLEAQVSFSALDGSYSVKLHERWQSHKEERDAVLTEIERIEASILASRPPAIGALAATAPISPPLPGDRPQQSVYGPDANSPVYGGSPYWPSRRRGVID